MFIIQNFPHLLANVILALTPARWGEETVLFKKYLSKDGFQSRDGFAQSVLIRKAKPV